MVLSFQEHIVFLYIIIHIIEKKHSLSSPRVVGTFQKEP